MSSLQEKKVKGVADIVFVLDVSGSMGPVIEDLKRNISIFVDSLTTADANNARPLKDWRARVVGYRDAEVDGAQWFVDYEFVRDANQLKMQLASLTAEGGGDEPESLLDALYKVATMTASEKGAEHPNQWRHRREATRVVIVFTDASFKSPMAIPEARGGSLDDLKHVIMANRIILSIFAPQMPCYDALTDIDKSEVELIPYDASRAEGAVEALRDFTADTANFKNVLKQLAASVSKSADTELL